MNGLEEIVLAIKQKADGQGAEIIKNAEAKANVIKAEAEKTAAAESEKILSDADRKCDRNKEAAKSAAVSNTLKEILRYKSDTVNTVIEKMLEKLNGLDDKEYFEVIKKLVYSNFHKNESGKLMFGKKDAARIPDGFIAEINKTVSADGAELSLGDTADIENGFILCYGDIEENCSFDAIVSSKEDTIKDEIASILFA